MTSILPSTAWKHQEACMLWLLWRERTTCWHLMTSQVTTIYGTYFYVQTVFFESRCWLPEALWLLWRDEREPRWVPYAKASTTGSSHTVTSVKRENMLTSHDLPGHYGTYFYEKQCSLIQKLYDFCGEMRENLDGYGTYLPTDTTLDLLVS